MSTVVSNTRLRQIGAATLVALALVICRYSLSLVLAPHEPTSGRVIGGLAILGVTVPLVGGGFWIWTTGRSLNRDGLVRILGWCGIGMVPLTTLSVLIIVYQQQHGVALAEPFEMLLWIAGGGAVGGLITGVYDVRRREASRRQQRAADRLSRLVDAAPVPIIEHDADGTVRRWNDAAERVFGWSAEEAIGDRLPFLPGPDDPSGEFATHQNRVLADEQLINVEIQRETKAGEPREFLLSTAPIPDEADESPGAVMGILVDITDQNQQREQLELFRALLDHSTESIFVVDAETGGFEDVNETACECLGYDRAELLELSVTDVEQSLSTKEDWQGHVGTIRDEGSVLYEGRQVRKDGSTFPVEVNIAHVVLDQEYTVAIARDISERKARERERTQFQKAVEHAGYAIYITDRDGTIEYANPAFEDVTGYPLDEAVGSDPSILQSGEHDTEYYRRLWSTILDGQIWEEEVVNQRRSGERYTAHQTIAPIYEDETIVGFVAIQSDMTAQHLREQRISVLNRVLRHNLKNAVNVISGHVDLLLTEGADPEFRTYLDRIDDQARSLASLSEKAQTVTRALDNTQPPVHAVRISSILTQLTESFGKKYPNSDITIHNRASDAIVVDGGIEPALVELLENALKHNDTARPDVRIVVEETQNDRVSIAVADDGPGIPDIDQHTISHNAPEEPLQHSSGIGLWLAKWTTTALGGTVEITDNDPRGSVVSVSLPVIFDDDDLSDGYPTPGTADTQYETAKHDD